MRHGPCGCTNRHLYQRIIEHTSSRSSTGKHMKQHGVDKLTIVDNFSVLEKCRNKLDYLDYEIVFRQDLKPLLNLQSDLIRAKSPNDVHNSTLTLYDNDVGYETWNNITPCRLFLANFWLVSNWFNSFCNPGNVVGKQQWQFSISIYSSLSFHSTYEPSLVIVFFQKCIADPRAKGLPLSSYLLKPLQRICKYPLLIREVSKLHSLLRGLVNNPSTPLLIST